MDNGMVIGGLAGSSGGVQGDAGLEEGGEGDGHFEGVVDDGRGGGKKMPREVLGDTVGEEWSSVGGVLKMCIVLDG